jgi:predicted nucleic acid-binding protein
MKLYIDTNVYLDFFLERIKSKYAEKIFIQTISCKHQIIISDHLLMELTKNLDYKKATILFEILKPKLINVMLDKKDKIEAKKLMTHYEDALHIILARKAGADIIITNNISDFESLFKTKRPENL